ncbi:MAG TPA: 4-(cytidine 5'-diphospho)-2-C-methyl-D-erythritol kinase [Oceanicaulis sp.]|uniref:4-(cytidine 5'-diphospho)-2-C-methyl-D-erythritol kinase n=1 Tax=unclassified Oceanicaulis TaxID=2632123 RepID=UPI0002FF48FF|nr:MULTISPECIES: 4-(cytidine 5'-diphospho)-2-C-methyl-D-erythritol kinase [unclassified Oceanicaulis]HCR95806.1 4-(cytidine 5'-diphospho)-2-C-methyl-D-erythritol kinase [Oceanicaulis sp.]
MTDAATEFAPAKVNLTLRVGGPRADGYHPLESLVVFADWSDQLRALPAETLTLSLTGPGAEGLQADPQNLVLKAAYALRAAADKPELGATLTLDKHLPVAAGLGGGSSDAAAALRLLNRVWDLGFSIKQLAEIGTVVGADVPACVHARPLRMEGIGERVTPLIAWPALHGVIVHPGAPVPTGPVFKAYDATEPGRLMPGKPMIAGTLDDAIDRLLLDGNDLQAPAIAQTPVIQTALDVLSAQPGARLARMSGSGASCFALFETADAAQAGADVIAREHADWTAKAVVFGGAA